MGLPEDEHLTHQMPLCLAGPRHSLRFMAVFGILVLGWCTIARGCMCVRGQTLASGWVASVLASRPSGINPGLSQGQNATRGINGARLLPSDGLGALPLTLATLQFHLCICLWWCSFAETF